MLSKIREHAGLPFGVRGTGWEARLGAARARHVSRSKLGHDQARRRRCA